jgi:hypothetical protein
MARGGVRALVVAGGVGGVRRVALVMGVVGLVGRGLFVRFVGWEAAGSVPRGVDLALALGNVMLFEVYRGRCLVKNLVGEIRRTEPTV